VTQSPDVAESNQPEPPSRLVRCQLDHPAVGDHLVAHLRHEHLARLTGDVAGELLAAVSGIHPKGPGDQLDRRADIAYPERLDSHSAAGPGEIAAAVLYLASPQAAFIAGTDLLIDGGATAWHVNGAGYARGSTPGGAGDLETAVGGVSPAPFGRRG
jgi:hypothetical protein